MSEGPAPEVKLTPTQLRKLRRKNNKKIRKLKAIENSESKIKKHDSKSKNKPKQRRYSKKIIEGEEKPKRKRYRGKKKKANGEVVPPPPNIKDLNPEVVSTNWKSLMKTIPVRPRPKSSTYIPPAKRQKVSHEVKSEKEKATVQETPDDEEPEVWFDDVDPCLIDIEPKRKSEPVKESGNKSSTGHSSVTRIVGIDCEMVGVGNKGFKSNLARVSIVNHFGNLLYDSYVKPVEEVTDYRTEVSGIRPENLTEAPTFKEVQEKVAEIIDKRILVGHAIKHDLKALKLSHPGHLIRDTSKFYLFRQQFGKTPGLKKLLQHYFAVEIQSGEHCSIEDAQGAVRLYTMFKTQWEAHIEKINEKRFGEKTDRESSKPSKPAKKQPRSIDVSALFKN